MLLEAIEYRLLPKRHPQSSIAKVLPRKAALSQNVLYAIGGMSRREATKSAERYDPKEGRWKAIGTYSFILLEYFQNCLYKALITTIGYS